MGAEGEGTGGGGEEGGTVLLGRWSPAPPALSQISPQPSAVVLTIFEVTSFRENLMRAVDQLPGNVHTCACTHAWAQSGSPWQGPRIPGSGALCLAWGARLPRSPSHHFLVPPLPQSVALSPTPHTCPPRGPARARPAHLERVEEVPEGPGVDDIVVHGQEEGHHHAGHACAEAEL